MCDACVRLGKEGKKSVTVCVYLSGPLKVLRVGLSGYHLAAGVSGILGRRLGVRVFGFGLLVWVLVGCLVVASRSTFNVSTTIR